MKRDVSLKVENFLTRATESRWMDGWVGGWTKNEYTKIDKRKPEQRGKRALHLEHLIAELEQRDKKHHRICLTPDNMGLSPLDFVGPYSKTR